MTATTQPSERGRASTAREPGAGGVAPSRPSPAPPGSRFRSAAGSWWSATCSSPPRPRRRPGRHRRAGPGPRHLGRTGHPDHRRQPLRPLRLGSPLAECQRALDAHPALGRALSRFLTVDERRVIRQTGTHEPGYDTDPETIAAIAARGRRAGRPGRPPSPHRHRRPGGAGGARRACLRLGVQRARDRVRPGRRRQARGHRPVAGRPGVAIAGRPVRPTTRPGWSGSTG